jgi:hypothetical protein
MGMMVTSFPLAVLGDQGGHLVGENSNQEKMDLQ